MRCFSPATMFPAQIWHGPLYSVKNQEAKDEKNGSTTKLLDRVLDSEMNEPHETEVLFIGRQGSGLR